MFTALIAVIFGLLYRLRGGWWRDLTGIQVWYNGTHAMRAIWSVPAGVLIYFFADSHALWLLPASIVSVFLSLAFWGHGAHMVFDAQSYKTGTGNKTELLTRWLPRVFGGEPDLLWKDRDVTIYNLVGMSTIGVVRHATMIAPLWFVWFVQPAWPLALFVALGLAHGPLYWAAWRLGGQSQLGEFLVGAAMAAAIMMVI